MNLRPVLCPCAAVVVLLVVVAGDLSQAQPPTPDELSILRESGLLDLDARDPLRTMLRLNRSRQVRVPFKQPETIRSESGELVTTLVVRYGDNTIGDNPASQVSLRSYNGKLTGPTLRVKRGDTLRIRLDNQLPPETDPERQTPHGFNTTNLHTHGLHVSPSGISDNVLLHVAPQTHQDYVIEIPDDHPSGTFWYHAHKHGSVAIQLASGMAGALIVEGGLDEVPAIKAAADQVFLFQQIPFDDDGLVNDFGQVDGPAAWANSNRYTTINGVQIPDIVMRPGEVQRWRFIHGGIREALLVQLDGHVLNEIAADGLAFGSMKPRGQVELHPGYRSDVLVQASLTPGVYLLSDGPLDADRSLLGEAESRKLLARVYVEGDPVRMNLPTDDDLDELAPFDSITDGELTGEQTMTFDLSRVAGRIRYTVDGHEFSPTANIRTLTVGDVDEWTLRTTGLAGAHPFHIHVNPFEVLTKDDDGNVIDRVWRDTVLVRRGQPLTIRTRYRRFTGRAVLHCHILDHEDQGMMQIIDLVHPDPVPTRPGPPVVKRAALMSAARSSSSDIADSLPSATGRASVTFFVQDSECEHCMEQLVAMSQKLAGKELDVFVVARCGKQDLQRFPDVPFKLIADPRLKLFARFAAVADGEPRHATIVRDGNGRRLLTSIGDAPLNDERVIFSALAEGAPSVTLAVRGTDDADDDYITWAPTRCEIRLTNPADDGEPKTVTLTNDAALNGGDVGFADSLVMGQTATQDSVTLELAADGSPTEFFIAGVPDRASVLTAASLANRGRDAVIVIRDGDASGPELSSHAVMVRVRKNASTLNPLERAELLDAVATVKGDGRYKALVDVHTKATGRESGANWFDQAHRNAAFLPWHRAFLLRYERELQKSHPHVALHYWREDQVSTVFVPEFFGANSVSGGTSPPLVEVDFGDVADGNPLHGWTINGTPLRRLARNRLDTSWCRPEASVLTPTSYRSAPVTGSFSTRLERDPHGDGHGWVGGWMSNCQTSPRDPIFFLFHCDIDRLWAKWQWTRDRFGTDGSDPDDYLPNTKFAPGSTTPFGHHLKDTMWPWDGLIGEQGTGQFDNRPDLDLDSPFPASGLKGVWPENPAAPFVHTMIDYLNISGSGIDLGFCYDDTPYGVKPATVPTPAPVPLLAFENRALSVRSRTDRIKRATGGSTREQLRSMSKIAADSSEPDSVRAAAFDFLEGQSDSPWIDSALTAIRDGADTSETMRATLIEKLGVAMMFTDVDRTKAAEICTTLRSVLTVDSPPAIRTAALSALTTAKDEHALTLLTIGLANPRVALVPRDEAVRLLAVAVPGGFRGLLRKLISNRDAEPVRVAALLSLGGDRVSAGAREEVAGDANEPRTVRQAALRSLLHERRFPEIALRIVQDATEGSGMRAAAAGALQVHVLFNAASMGSQSLRTLADRLRTIKTDNRELQPVIARVIRKVEAIAVRAAAKS